ncbi:hypothetical protein [Ruminiclostridium cellobioparum]|uniref:Uncharacterized protein n=1 Tax=Ruminiclostridium cellobioparum subsp. termitidis CT1112 TaxID=1195236 RepID=S0FGM8_RUMCE|nr:hypothetical protein [Ruminiclostridium cellobioparum]EMS70277.1 hypothetical protein CTER_3986 [Ruminiclostridium cellobioparum subsp. termitidis CT1112]
MQTLVIYDETGFIISQMQGSDLRESIGVPYIFIEIPQNKILKSIDVSKTEHKPVFEDLPKPETQKLQELIDQLIIDNLNMQQ